jgi:hypothetical protein
MLKKIIPYIAAFIIAAFIIANVAYALCYSSKSISATYDSQLPVSSGTYVPCDPWMEWTIKFSRTSFNGSPNYLFFKIDGGPTFNRQYRSNEVQPGDYSFTGLQNLGQPTTHEMTISKSTSTNGHWQNMSFQTIYWADQPDSPPGP